jgi:hypothetical protein
MHMPGPRDLLKKLFGYIEEQLKDVDPRGFHLSKLSGFKVNPDDLRHLPGIELDIKTEGDHIWLKVERLEAVQPPQITDKSLQGLITFSTQPTGSAPSLDETAIQHKIASLVSPQASVQERQEAEREIRAKANEYLKVYTPQWQNWAHTETLRRRTISLYSDLFSLIRVISSNETSKPVEFVCGLGVAAWNMKSEVGSL